MAPAPSPPNLSVEHILNTIVAEYCKVLTPPVGPITSNPFINESGLKVVKLQGPLPTMHVMGRAEPLPEPPRIHSFGEFCTLPSASDRRGLPPLSSELIHPKTAFEWYGRCMLRFCCGILCNRFLQIVADLKEAGVDVTRIRRSAADESKTLDLTKFKPYMYAFVPKLPRHALHIEFPIACTSNIVDIEKLQKPEFEHEWTEDTPPPDQLCSHTFLADVTTTMVLDPSLGQFTGRITPYMFDDEQDYYDTVPGEYFQVFPAEEEDAQNEEDAQRARESPDYELKRFSQLVVACLLDNKYRYCQHCLGASTSKPNDTRTTKVTLKRCSLCREVCYCSRVCQKMHWKTHKKDCHKKD